MRKCRNYQGGANCQMTIIAWQLWYREAQICPRSRKCTFRFVSQPPRRSCHHHSDLWQVCRIRPPSGYESSAVPIQLPPATLGLAPFDTSTGPPLGSRDGSGIFIRQGCGASASIWCMNPSSRHFPARSRPASRVFPADNGSCFSRLSHSGS